jgi:hypothetical protein
MSQISSRFAILEKREQITESDTIDIYNKWAQIHDHVDITDQERLGYLQIS